MKKEFNDFRFEGLNFREQSNKYFTMNRVNKEETKIVIRVGDGHLLKTKFGYALVLDQENVVFLKDWQVNKNYFGNEVLLTREFWQVKKWGNHEEFDGVNEELHDFDYWLDAAAIQDAAIGEDGFKTTMVRWEK